MKLLTNLCCLLLFFASLNAQNRTNLQKRKKNLLEEIQLINQMLEKTKQQKTFSLNQLKTLKQKIEIRSQLIATIEKELRFIHEERALNLKQKKLFEEELESLKNNYALMIKQSYKSTRKNSRILFLLSSRDFQQAFKRLAMIKQISEYRKSQATKIEYKQKEVNQIIKRLEKHTKIKERLINDTNSEKLLLNEEQITKSIGLVELSNKEKKLTQGINEKKLKKEKIEKEIQRIIAEELRKEKENKKRSFAETPDSERLSNSFTSNKALLPWPVSKGLVISKFGKQKHAVLKGVTVDNNGIEIATESNTLCRSVFDGTVSSVLTMPNGTKVIMIRHGEFISVYSNLGESLVRKGEIVKTKDPLGVIYTSKSEGATVIDFQLWKGSQKVNPEIWLMKK